jgi:acetyl-CoA carboxylase biotin carboxyl carrier protein
MSAYKPNAMEAAWIRELAAILDETGLTEIEIEKSDVRVRVARGAAGPAAAAFAPVAAAQPPRLEAQAPPAPKPSGTRSGAITSPMVGTVYLAASPGHDPYVKVGDKVAQGQTLMIVEAMKTMNPITAPKPGVVLEILVRDAQPVEYGEELIVIE